MKIISGFRDYYDGVARHGRDEGLLYVRQEDQKCRKTEGPPGHWTRTLREVLNFAEVGYREWRKGQPRYKTMMDLEWTVYGHLAVVGEQVRVGWRLGRRPWYRTLGEDRNESFWAYDVETLGERLANGSKRERKAWAEYLEHDGPCFWQGEMRAPRKRCFAEVQERAEKIAREVVEWIDAPCGVVRWMDRREELEADVHGPLEAVAAWKAWPAETAYQEIMRVLANRPGDEAAMVRVDDGSLARQKGFDRQSFRRPPGKGRPRGRNAKPEQRA